MKLIKNYKKFLLKEDLELNSEVVPNDVEASNILKGMKSEGYKIIKM